MDAINMAVLAELKEYAQLYFSAIVELHTVEGKCNLKPGKYSAKELVDNLKAACGSYGLPTDEIFNEDIEISVETFNCKFPYHRIFSILAQWEAMCKAGKQKAEIKPICELYDNSEASPELEPELDAGLYYEWLKRAEKGSYKTIAEKAMTEAWINIFLAAYKCGKGHVLAMNERGELVDTVFVLNNAPQPPETPQTVKHTTCVYKPRETVRKLPKLVIRNCRTTHVRQELGVQGYSMLADASATLAAINAPPIRGDCKIGVFQRAKPPNSTLYKKISILQPP